MLNQTRAHPGIARESKFQGPGISACWLSSAHADPDTSGRQKTSHGQIVLSFAVGDQASSEDSIPSGLPAASRKRMRGPVASLGRGAITEQRIGRGGVLYRKATGREAMITDSSLVSSGTVLAAL